MPRDQAMDAEGCHALGMWDAVSIIVGIVVGAGIYETAPLVFQNVPGPEIGIVAWLTGGLLSLIGALCYAELATTYPRSGGDYVYLTRAYGPMMGFLFGWAQLAVILTGSIGMMAFVFADYAGALWSLSGEAKAVLAACAILALTLTNALGVGSSKKVQNVLTVLNVLSLVTIIIAGIVVATAQAPSTFDPVPSSNASSVGISAFGLAMIFVLYTYGGWNDAAFVAADVRDRRRNIPRALIIGTTIITLLYVSVNVAYVAGLGFEGVRKSSAVASELLAWPLGRSGLILMSVFVMISALGAVNGLIFTGSRVYTALGRDHGIFRPLAAMSPTRRSAPWSLLAQALVSVTLVLLVGTSQGRSVISTTAKVLSLAEPEWQGHGGFESLMRCTAPIFWFFFLLTGGALFILRFKDPRRERPFAVPLYPLLPLIFCSYAAFMLVKSLAYAGPLAWVGLAFLAAGFPLYLASAKRTPRRGRTVLSEPKGVET